MGGFFGSVIGSDDIRRMVMALAVRTGWGLAELLDLTLEDLAAWVETAQEFDPKL